MIVRRYIEMLKRKPHWPLKCARFGQHADIDNPAHVIGDGVQLAMAHGKRMCQEWSLNHRFRRARDDCSELTFNHVRRLPHRVEHRELRIVYWSTLITLLRVAHVGRFPNRSFGKDLQLIIIYGAVILAFLEGRKPTIASIARYLQLPHETTRRYLKTVVDLGLLTKDGRSYKPTERSRKGVTGAGKIERLLRQAGRELYL